MSDLNVQLAHNQIPFQKKRFPVCIVADNLELARNIGSLFRIADAFGVEKVYLTGTSNTASDLKIRKAARSTHKAVDYNYTASAIDIVTQKKEQGYLILSLEITSKSQSVRELSLLNLKQGHAKTCLIIGSENQGVSQQLLDLSDHTIHIPMYGQNSSMNVVTASAIALYELVNTLQENQE